MSRGNDNEKPEHPIVLLGVACVVLLVFGFLIWLVASNRIVYGTLRPALFLGAIWTWFPTDFATLQWNSIVMQVTAYASNPTGVSVIQWGGLVNTATRPLAFLLMVAYIVFVLVIGSKKKTFTRRFSADQLMEYSVKRFTGIAPVVKIRMDIAKDKNPLWRRQVTPDEIFNGYRVSPRDAIFNPLIKSGMPMTQGGKFDREVARAYFSGYEGFANEAQKRIKSRMLGRQLVHLLVDSSKSKSVVFTDRMSNEGKAVFALWAAIAFGEIKDGAGKKEYSEYRDKLNLSAYGTKDGMANLGVIQPLYDKYRKHPMVNRMFAVHHWEHTFLFALLAIAQRKGRFTTAEVLWLRPMNRVMFFALNTRGSYTPHTEAATTFSQVAYETGCAKYGRLPLVRTSDGNLIHLIYTDKVIDGMFEEWSHWVGAIDEDEDVWNSPDVWKRVNLTVNEHFKQIQAVVPTAPMKGVDPELVTAFDASETNKAEEKAKLELLNLQEEIAATKTASSESDDVLAFLSS